MAELVHAADVSEGIDKDPIARGLEAIASGYSLRFPEDLENLEHQVEVYDALYAWCKEIIQINKTWNERFQTVCQRGYMSFLIWQSKL